MLFRKKKSLLTVVCDNVKDGASKVFEGAGDVIETAMEIARRNERDRLEDENRRLREEAARARRERNRAESAAEYYKNRSKPIIEFSVPEIVFVENQPISKRINIELLRQKVLENELEINRLRYESYQRNWEKINELSEEIRIYKREIWRLEG